MARWTASAKWAAGPALDGERAMPLALRLSEGLGVDETVVLSMGAHPKPMYAVASWKPERSEVKADACAVKLAATQELELQRGMQWISFQ